MKTIQFYEDEGIMPRAERTGSGYRSYGDGDVDRLRFVRQAKRLGLSLAEIRQTLGLYDSAEATCIHVRSLIDEKITQADAAIRDLRAFRSQSVELRDRAGDMVDCHPSEGNICGIIERSEIVAPAAGAAFLGR